MSGISPVGPHTIGSSAEGTASSIQAERPTSDQSYTPLWAVGTISSSGGVEKLSGLPAPRAAGDVTALLAEVSFSLEQSIDEAREKSGFAQLAAFANALSPHNTWGLRKLVEGRRQTVANAEASLQEVKKATAPLAAARSEQNELIRSYKEEIQRLKGELRRPNLSESRRAVLEEKLSIAQAGLADAFAARDTIDIELANVRIDSLERQIRDVEVQLAAIDPETFEAKTARVVLDAKRIEMGAAQQELQDFVDGRPRTEATRNRFSERNFSALQAETKDLSDRLTGYQKQYAEAEAQLAMATAQSQSTIVRAAATLRAEQLSSHNLNAMRDLGIENAFEGIAASLDAIQGFALQRFQNLASNQEARSEGRIQQIAYGILTVIGDLVTAVSQMDPNVYDPVATYPTTGSRFRLEV